ncbi:MAG: P1 family peptidase [Enterococcus sp.]
MNGWQEIPINEIAGVRFGQAQSEQGLTGVTVAIFDQGGLGGLMVCGGGPASRETLLLSPLSAPKKIHAIVFSGGSAYGLAAADGVMKYLEERAIGYHIHNVIVPLVVQSSIFDLLIGDEQIRPDAQMAYEACLTSEKYLVPQSGSVGAGKGATVGKVCGMQQAQKSGIGFFALSLGKLQVGAMVVVNAVGDIFDYQTHQQLAGTLTQDRQHFLGSEKQLQHNLAQLKIAGNTTLGAIFTNAKFSEVEMNRIAKMASFGLARSISPVATLADGDSIYACSLGEESADLNVVGTLAATVLSEAITLAIKKSTMTETEFLAQIR